MADGWAWACRVFQASDEDVIRVEAIGGEWGGRTTFATAWSCYILIFPDPPRFILALISVSSTTTITPTTYTDTHSTSMLLCVVHLVFWMDDRESTVTHVLHG